MLGMKLKSMKKTLKIKTTFVLEKPWVKQQFVLSCGNFFLLQ
jgi:hypothetical protein